MKMYTTKEAAEVLNVKPRTVQRYTKLPENALPITEIANLRGDMVFSEYDLLEFARNHGLTVRLIGKQ